MSTHSDPEKEKVDPKLLPVIIQKKQDRQDIERAEGEGYSPPAQEKSLEEAREREKRKNKI